MDLDDLDKAILNMIQGDFPISNDPYGDIGRAVGCSGGEALRRVRSLVSRGVIRKVGPFFDAKKMGYRSTLCAVHVPPERLEETVSAINSFDEVTHNYLRGGEPNLWFTVIAPTEKDIEEILDDISCRAGVAPIYNLPARKTLKIKVDLKVEG